MKTKNLLPLIFALAFFAEANAQTKFSRVFWQNLEYINTTAITQTSDSGYVVAGNARDNAPGSLPDIFLAKISSIGDTVWTKRIGGSGTDDADDVMQTNDGGYIIAGNTNSYGAGNYDALLLKTDSLGNVMWMKTYGDVNNDYAYSVKQNSDNGYIMAGLFRDTTDKLLVIRTNSTGDTLWTKKYWSGEQGGAYCAIQTSDGGFIVSGTYGTGSFNAYKGGLILKLTSSGAQSWAKGFYFGEFVVSRDVSQTADGGYVLTTEQDMSSMPSSAYLHKFDSNGNQVFGKNFYATSFQTTTGMRTRQLSDGTYLTVGNAGSIMLNKIILIKCAVNGDTLWTKTLDNSSCGDAVFTLDNGIAFASTIIYYSPPPGIIKIDSSLNAQCNSFQNYNNGYSVYNTPTVSVSMSSTAGIIVNNPAPTIMSYVPRRLYSPCTPNIPTCVVTVDSATQKNLVVWEENFDTTFIDSYQVYKESAAAGVYNLIGSVPVNQFSTFLDNASNPAVQSARYRVSALWHNFYEPPNTVAGHKTIHLSINLGLPPSINLIWSVYEGFTYPTYNIWRGNGTSASIIASVAFGTNSYTDLTPPPGDSLYFIEVVHTPCVPTFMQPPHGNSEDEYDRDLTGPYDGTRSNIANRSTLIGIDEITNASNLFLYPNPAENEFTIYDLRFTIGSVDIYDVLGKKCLSHKPQTSNLKPQTVSVDISKLSPGIYFVKVKGNNEERVGKFVKD